jgi:hypothetical protein
MASQETKWYRETIEALGMLAPKARIINKLNKVAAHSDDAQLREMARTLIKEISSATANTTSIAPQNMKNAVPSAKQVIAYCEPLAYPAE